MGEIQFLLNLEFLNQAHQGGVFEDTISASVTALAMSQSKGFGPSRQERQSMGICHAELVRLVRSGLRLDQAVMQARMTEPAASAFKHLQDTMLARMERGQA